MVAGSVLTAGTVIAQAANHTQNIVRHGALANNTSHNAGTSVATNHRGVNYISAQVENVQNGARSAIAQTSIAANAPTLNAGRRVNSGSVNVSVGQSSRGIHRFRLQGSTTIHVSNTTTIRPTPPARP